MDMDMSPTDGAASQAYAHALDTAVSPPAMVLRSGRKKRKEGGSVPSSPASTSSGRKRASRTRDSDSVTSSTEEKERSRKKSRTSLSAIREQSDSEMAESPLLSHPQTLTIDQTAAPNDFSPSALNAAADAATATATATATVVVAARRHPGRRLSDLFLSSAHPQHGQHVDSLAARRPPSTPMELTFGDNCDVTSDEQRDGGRRDGLSQELLRQNTQSISNSCNVQPQPFDDGPTLFTTHSSILRPLPTRPPIASTTDDLSSPTTLATEDPTKRLQYSQETQNLIDHSGHHQALQDWKVWALIFVIAHLAISILFHQQHYVLPVWKSIPQRSSSQLLWYKETFGKLGIWENQTISSKADVTNNNTQGATSNNILYKRMLLQEYRKLKDLMQDAVSEYGPLLRELETTDPMDLSRQVEDLDKKLKIQINMLEEWEDALNQVELDMNTLWQSLASTDPKMPIKPDTRSLKKSLHRLKKLSPVPIEEDCLFLLDLDPLNEYQTASENSEMTPTNKDFVPKRDFEVSKQQLMDYALSAADKLVNSVQSNKVMDEFIQSTIDTLKQSMIPYTDGNPDKALNTMTTAKPPTDMPDSTHKYLSTNSILAMINERLETDRADMTGKLDYASVRSGAKVIRSGPRQSSSSLTEDVPLLNRFMAVSKLRFYGHKAEAALSPTYPRNSLGQCWSFTKESGKRKIILLGKETEKSLNFQRDLNRGAYATLSVKLARPIRVTQVVVEHPIHIGSSATTAIQNFRVYGYEDDLASNIHSWYLGSFKFDIYDTSPLQHFKVSQISEDGQLFPLLRSVVLAIDSNWGGNYSCLYRFRVHGE